jgi:hypothetical protein
VSSTFEEQLFPSDTAMSPTFVLGRFSGMLDKYGAEVVRLDGRFKKAREMWTGAVFLLGLGKAMGKEYWLSPEHVDQTPDIHGLSIAAHQTIPDGTILERIAIEVTEWEEHAGSGLAETILRKLAAKSYPDHFVLLVLARRAGQLVDLDAVAERLRQERERLRVGEIWVLGRPEDSPMGGRHVLRRVFPQPTHVEFVLTDKANAKAGQMQMVKFSRGKGGELLDEAAYIPFPSLD